MEAFQPNKMANVSEFPSRSESNLELAQALITLYMLDQNTNVELRINQALYLDEILELSNS